MKIKLFSLIQTVCAILILAATIGCDENESDETGELGASNALIITSDYTTGAYSVISMDDLSVTKDINAIHSDAVCRYDGITQMPYILLRMGADAVNVLDSATFDITKEYSVDANTNPQDIAVVSKERAYVSRYASTEILIVNPTTGAKLGVVDVGTYADDDGSPEVAGMTVFEGNVYALVQRLDTATFAPVDKSYLLKINGANGTVEKEFELASTNPSGGIFYSDALKKMVIVEAGAWGTSKDDGVELFDPAAETLSGLIVTEEALGGAITKVAVVSSEKAYALIGVAEGTDTNTHVVIFNPTTGKTETTLLQGTGWVHTTFALTPDKTELWVTDGTVSKAGIRIFDVESDKETTTAPINVGLPPTDICFVK